ncbi:MAG TPA: DNA internalization-related competence protein ComEC/Rec2 [Thermoanaerobaculia bacterium]
MHDEAPAALPLLAFICGLLIASNAIAFAVIAALIWRWSRRASIAIAFFALGAIRAGHAGDRVEVSLDRFATIEAPISSDWSAHDHVHFLRCSRFTSDGVEIAEPVTIYARFEPKAIGREQFVEAQGMLRSLDGGRYTLSVKSPRLLSYHGTISTLAPSTWNRLAEQRLNRYAPMYPQEVAMIEALVLGRGERLSDDAKQNFRRGGTYHLLVFSGLQIALAAGLIAFALRWAGAPRVSDWSLLAFAALAPAFIGPTASVSRSSVGIALYALSRILKRPTSFENLWCVAALARLILVPGDIADPAFHLTYAGAGALIFIGKPMATRVRWIGYAAAAELVITPLTLFHFHQFALGGSVMTVLLTPIIFVMLVVGAAFCVTELTLLLRLIAVLNALCSWLNNISSPFSGFFAAPQQLTLAIALIAAVASIALLNGKRRAIAIAALFAIPASAAIVRHVSLRSTPHPHVTFLDVGQGDSILLRSGSHNVLIDGGGRSEDPRFGETVLLPMLVDRGVRKIDIVILSHAHPDHCGGLPAVIEQLRVGEVWLNPRRFRGECAQMMLDAIRDRGTPVRLVRDRATATAGELHLDAFTVTHAIRRAAENNSSIVVRVDTRGRSLLLTGDIEREAESELSPRIRPVDILKVAHHGSRSSSTAALLDAAAPRIAVISCGARNWFGHPHESVLKSLSARHIRVWRIDRYGAIDVDIDPRVICRPQFDTPR